MQAIELATTISAQGNITLPNDLRELYGGRRARVILLIEDSPESVSKPSSREERQHALRQALAAVADAGIFSQVGDVVAWQREMRADRNLFGRED